jgi:hypothetical protein
MSTLRSPKHRGQKRPVPDWCDYLLRMFAVLSLFGFIYVLVWLITGLMDGGL